MEDTSDVTACLRAGLTIYYQLNDLFIKSCIQLSVVFGWSNTTRGSGTVGKQ